LNGRDIVHRDVKPANILLAGGVAKLTDFGLARLSVNDVTKTLGGTPLYQSPEMFEGKVVKGASDQYCLAMTYAELRRGEHPFADYLEGAGKKRGVQHAHRFEAPNLRGLSEGEQKVLKTALAKQYQDRFVTCTEFVEALQEAVAEEATAARVPPKSDEFEAEPDFKYEDEPASGGFGWLTAAVLLLAVIGGGIGFYFWNRPKPDAIAGEIKNNIDQFVLVDPPEVDKAWIEVERGDKLGSPWKEDVREHFTDFTHNRIADLEKAGDMKTATATAKLLRNHMPEDTALDGTKRNWLQNIDGQIGRGAVAALSEIRDFEQILRDEKLPSPYREVLNSAKAIEAVESGKGKADDAFASLHALPEQAAQLRPPLYKRLAEQCLKTDQFLPLFKATSEAKQVWPEAGQFRITTYDRLVKRLSHAIYEEVGEWGVNEIYNTHLKDNEKANVREPVRTAYVKRMGTLLQKVHDKFAVDPKGWQAILEKVDELRVEFSNSYQEALKGTPDDLRHFWKCVYELDKCLSETSPQPKEVFKHYVALLDAKGTPRDAKGMPSPLDFDKHILLLVELAKQHPGEFDKTQLERIADRSKQFRLQPQTIAMVKNIGPIAQVQGQVAKSLANVATLYGKGDFAECKKHLKLIDQKADDFKQNHAKFDALDALVHAQLVDTDVPRLVGAWKTLPAGDKTELGKHFAAVADKYLKDHWREAPVGDQKNGWRLRMDLCEAGPPEKSAVVAASALECRIELKEAKNLPAEWQSLSELLQKSPWPGEPQVGRAYSGYLKALAHAADKQSAANALVEIQDVLPQLPSDYRKQRAVNMLVDASPKPRRQGTLDDQFKESGARDAFSWLSLAVALNLDKKLELPGERMIDLVLATACQPNLDAATREKAAALATKLIADTELFKKDDLSKAIYPLTMAYARLSDQPATVVRAYAELLDRLKAADRKEIGDLEFSREVLRKGIDLGRPNAKAPEDKANLARLIGEQADMILTDKEDPEKLAQWNKEFNGDALAEAQKLFAEASKLDSKNSIYRAGSQWLSGFSKLQSARLKENEAEKQAAYGTSISILQLALDSAKGLEPSQLLFLSRLYLDLHQAELEFGNYYWSLHYWLPKGYGANYDARSKMMARLNSALSYAQKAKEALNGAGDKAVDFEIQIHEALGKAHDGLANLAEVDHQQNFSKAQEQFNNAIDTLKSNRPTSWTGRGLVRYNWARFEKDKDAKTALLKKAEKDLIEANRLAGDGWEAIEPNYFLAKVYDDLDKLKIGRPHIYAKVMSLYDSLPAKPSESNFAQNTARHYVKEAVLRLSRPSTPQLETYARFMQGIDPSCAADLFLRHAAVSWQAAGKDVVTGLDKIAGANPGALESAVVVMRAKHVAKTYQDDQTKKIEIPEMERAKLLKQLRKNCKVAPDDYLRLWSRYTLAGVLYYSKEAKDADEACENYLEAKKIADELLRKHGTIEEIKEYRKWKSSNFKVWTDLDVNDWDRLFILYEDGANLLYALAVGKKRDEYLKEAASFVNAALNLMKRDHTERERVETLKRKIEADMRMK
jgi:hypothetical protein